VNFKKDTISFYAYLDGEKHELQTHYGEYRNLMALLFDKLYIEDFGECKGMGRCGTCVIKLEGLPGTDNALQRNEQTTLLRTGLNDEDLRLACQILVDQNLQGVTINIIGSNN
jgi:ferredoxin, 2Fe-2S